MTNKQYYNPTAVSSGGYDLQSVGVPQYSNNDMRMNSNHQQYNNSGDF